MKCRASIFGLLVFVLSSVCFVAVAPVPSQSQNQGDRIREAKKEGKIVWYTSMNIAESRPLLDAFEKKYPFIKGELFRANSEKVLNRIMTETRGGRWGFDAVSLSEVAVLRENKLIGPYKSPEAAAISPNFKDPDGYWAGLYTNYYVIGYNKGLVPKKNAPKDWGDFLDPQWKGKIAIDREEYEWYATLADAWGKERARQYMKRLAKQDIEWRKGHTLITQLMAAGEFPLAIVYAHRAEDLKSKGAPIEWVNTLNPVVAAINGVALSARPDHPNATRLFIDFVLSKEGQGIIRSFNRIPTRADVDPISPMMKQERLNLKRVPDLSSDDYNQIVKEFRTIFNL